MAKREKKAIISGVTREAADEAFATYSMAEAHAAKITADIELQCAKIRGKYADKLICTHLNDNMGQTGDSITWLDDSHLLPFDGVADWNKIAERLNKAGYKGDLTFELTSKSKPERNTHDRYADLDFTGFAALALEKAKKFRDIIEAK